MVFKHLSNALEKVNRRLFRFGYARVSLVMVLLFVVTVVMARFIYSSITGYILPDEAWYYNHFILANHWPSFYREVFFLVYKLFFLGSGNMQSFLIRGTLYAVVLVGVPRNETEFRNLINQTKWDSIYLYDDWFTILDPSIQSSYPAYYWAILHSHDYSDFTVHILWADPESYAISLVRTNSTSSTST